MRIILRFCLLMSLLASLAFHMTGDYSVIEQRSPFLVVELAFSVADSPDFGTDQHGYYIGYGFDVQPGERVKTLMIYNPLSNYTDDIIARWDF